MVGVHHQQLPTKDLSDRCMSRSHGGLTTKIHAAYGPGAHSLIIAPGMEGSEPSTARKLAGFSQCVAGRGVFDS
jgi:hypothetical protein